MVGGLGQIGKVPELRNRVLFTLLMLAVYRLGVYVSTPGVDIAALRARFPTSDGSLFGMFNLFSGGSFEQFSIFTLGIMPYISVSIIVQFMTPLFPALEALKKEGAAGQRILTRYTRQGTIVLALIQGFFISTGLIKSGVVYPQISVWQFQLCTMITLTAGTAFIMWLGEQITERGIGNGMSIIIFAGIVAQMPAVLLQTLSLMKDARSITPVTVLLLLVVALATVIAIVFVENCQRKIPLQYPKRVNVGNMGPPQFLPLKVNMAGVIPPIFASAVLILPVTAGKFLFSENETVSEWMALLTPGSVSYSVIFALLIIAFSYYYTAVITNPVEIAENLKKSSAFIPTIRPGKQTADYLYGVLNRLTFWGGIYIALICLVPQQLYFSLGVPSFSYVFGGTSILIVVGVTLDTASQIQSHLIAKNYESFMAKSAKSRTHAGVLGNARTRVLRR